MEHIAKLNDKVYTPKGSNIYAYDLATRSIKKYWISAVEKRLL
jgi:hypothetical protein